MNIFLLINKLASLQVDKLTSYDVSKDFQQSKQIKQIFPFPRWSVGTSEKIHIHDSFYPLYSLWIIHIIREGNLKLEQIQE